MTASVHFSPDDDLKGLLQRFPVLQDFWASYALPSPPANCSVTKYFQTLPESVLGPGNSRDDLFKHFRQVLEHMVRFSPDTHVVHSLEIIGGHSKSGVPEELAVCLYPGDVLSIVGPTGAGKSRLLEDIECLAQGDTPTGRTILINGSIPDDELRFGVDCHLVAELSQNMNFVVDLTVVDFLTLHAESRQIEHPHQMVQEIFATANRLAGEAFRLDTSVTALSGGQSRALMIADTACLSRAPIVLIDEIENAGVDRRQALELLIQQEKIVLLVTHDPALALMAPRRLLINDGGMKAIIDRTEAEKILLEELLGYADRLDSLRCAMRNGSMMR